MTKLEFDISKYETLDEGVFTFLDPSGEELLGEGGEPVTVDLYGTGSKQYVNAKYKLDNDNQARSIAVLRGKTGKNVAEETRVSQAAFFAACTKSISNFPLAPIDIYKNPKLNYLTSQVDKWLGDDENFMPTPLKG